MVRGGGEDVEEKGSHLLLPLAVEERVEVGGAGAGLQGQDAPAVLSQVKFLNTSNACRGSGGGE